MAILNAATLGKAKGSIGNVTYTTDAIGRTIGKQKATTVRNPKTAAQELNRGKQRIQALFFKAILFLLNSYWVRSKANVSQYAEAVGKMRKRVLWTVADIGDAIATPIKVGQGNLEPFDGFAASSPTYTAGTSTFATTFNWNTSTFGNGLSTDKVGFALLNVTKNRVEGVETGVTRAAGSYEAEFTNVNAEDSYVVFPLLKSANNLLVGDAYTMSKCEAGHASIYE